MKNFLVMSILFLTFFGIKAQVIEINPELIDANFQDQDLSNLTLDFAIKYDVTNITQNGIALKWQREVQGDCEGWQTKICDNNRCYAEFVSTNIMLPDIDFPMYLEAQEACPECAVHILPKSNAGCCEIKLHFSLIEEPDNILGTVVVNANVNMDENCENEIVSIENAGEISSIKVFPNPTNEYFQLTNNNAVSSILLKNTLGQEVKNFAYNSDGQYDVSNLPSGFYFIQMQDSKGATLKLLPLTIAGN